MEHSNQMGFFKNRISQWVRYSSYTIKEEDGKRYITPSPEARLSIYDPLANPEELVADFLNYGYQLFLNPSDAAAEKFSSEIAVKYGLMGLMAALPKDIEFASFEETYLGRNGVFFGGKREIPTKEFMRTYLWHDSKENDPYIAYTMHRDEMYDIIFSKRYREPSVLNASFAEFLYTHFFSSINLSNEKFSFNERQIFRHKAMTFDNFGISFQMRADDFSEMLWHFDSLKTIIETAYCAFLTAENHPLHVCKRCGKIYYHNDRRNEFCSPRCRNQWNVYRSRKRKAAQDGSPE